MSKKLNISPESIKKEIEKRLGVEIFSRSNPSSTEVLSYIYYWLACLVSGSLLLRDIPVEAHSTIATYASSRKCMTYVHEIIESARLRQE